MSERILTIDELLKFGSREELVQELESRIEDRKDLALMWEAERRVRRKIVGLILREWATAKERGNEETARMLDLIATIADEITARELPWDMQVKRTIGPG